jgi:hypothetical protein
LNFHGSLTGPISADGLYTQGGLFFRKGFHVKGEIRLNRAKIDGDLDCIGARFENENAFALVADGIYIRGGVFLCDGFLAKGEVRLIGAKVDGNLVCDGATFENENGKAITADGLCTQGGFSLRKACVKGEVRMPESTIGGTLSCIGATFDNENRCASENENRCALVADRLSIRGGVFLRDCFRAKGEVRLLGAKIGGDLDCRSAAFENKDGYAISAGGLSTQGAVFLRDRFSAKGEVNLRRTKIGVNLECSNATFENENGFALSADGLSTMGSVFLNNGFHAKGEVLLVGANIGWDLNCIRATFENKTGNALNADGLSTQADVSLRNKFRAKGEVRLVGAKIGGDLACIDATFENENGNAFCAERMSVDGTFIWLTKEKPVGGIDLLHARVGQLLDDKKSWPEKDKLLLDGFEYGALAGDKTPTSAEERLEWIHLQQDKPFKPQPYEQLAKVLRQMGNDEDAKEVLIAKQEDLRKYGELSRKAKALNWVLGFTIGHGWKARKVIFRFIIPIILLGYVLFCFANHVDVMQPSKERVFMSKEFKETGAIPSTYPIFSPFIYSVDTFVPFVNLHQENYWLPDANKPYGPYFRWYLWLHIIFGWISSTLAVVSLTGLVRKE